jgi:hypothetical protein
MSAFKRISPCLLLILVVSCGYGVMEPGEQYDGHPGTTSTFNPLTQTVTLSWAANTESDMSHYNMYRSTVSGGPYDQINTTTIDHPTSTYVDETVVAGETYFYVVKAVDTSNRESDPSNEASVTIGEAVCLGDVNGDGARDILDVILILNHIVGSSSLSGSGLAAADIDANGAVDVLDSVGLQNHIVAPVLPGCS